MVWREALVDSCLGPGICTLFRDNHLFWFRISQICLYCCDKNNIDRRKHTVFLHLFLLYLGIYQCLRLLLHYCLPRSISNYINHIDPLLRIRGALGGERCEIERTQSVITAVCSVAVVDLVVSVDHCVPLGTCWFSPFFPFYSSFSSLSIFFSSFILSDG